MPTVYQTHYAPHIDVRPAMEYGDLEVLVQRPGEPSLAPVPLVQELRHGLRNFGPDDYLLPTGSPAVIAAAAAIAARQSGGTLRVLLWDRHEKRYYTTTMEV